MVNLLRYSYHSIVEGIKSAWNELKSSFQTTVTAAFEDAEAISVNVDTLNVNLDETNSLISTQNTLTTTSNTKLDIANDVLDNIYFDIDSGNCIGSIEVSHKKIHEGKLFYINSKITIPATTTVYALFKTGSKSAHNIFWASAAGEVELQSWEDATVSNNGTPAVILNKNRASANTPLSAIYLSPTFTAITNEVKIRDYLSGSGRTSPAQIREVYEVILKPNTNYLASITNTTNQSMNVILGAEFYEV